MKGWHIVILIIGVCIIAGGAFMLGDFTGKDEGVKDFEPNNGGTSTISWKSLLEEDESSTLNQPAKYTADRVIDVVQAQYIARHPSKGITDVQVTTSYLGNGIWSVEISAPIGYALYQGNTYYKSPIIKKFYENTGSLK